MINGRRRAAISIFLVSASLVAAKPWTNWHPTAWSALRLESPETVGMQAVVNGPFVFTNYLPQWNEIISGVSTSYVYGWPPDGDCSTNKVISTNTFFSDVLAYGGALLTTTVVNAWAFDLTDCTGGAYSVTRTVTNSYVLTNIVLQARDIVALDTHLAMQERYIALLYGRSKTNSIEKPRYYRGYRDALVYAKAYTSNLLQNGSGGSAQAKYIQPWQLSGETLDAYYSATSNETPPLITATGVLARIGRPTNYWTHTPWRELSGTGAVYGWSGVRAALTNATAYSAAVEYTWTGDDGQWNGEDTRVNSWPLQGYSGNDASVWDGEIITDWVDENYYSPGFPSFYAYAYIMRAVDTNGYYTKQGEGVTSDGTLHLRIDRTTTNAPIYGITPERRVDYYLRWARPDVGIGLWSKPSGYSETMHRDESVSVGAGSESDASTPRKLSFTGTAPFFPSVQEVIGYEALTNGVTLYGAEAVPGRAIVFPDFEYR